MVRIVKKRRRLEVVSETCVSESKWPGSKNKTQDWAAMDNDSGYGGAMGVCSELEAVLKVRQSGMVRLEYG